mmetsp:Transcript_70767/g.207308  ORF Transcript_70767/g.207308 Transcript_70767/m.207308 type:complete len:414 (+) Transcript_70767:61-1302(+)
MQKRSRGLAQARHPCTSKPIPFLGRDLHAHTRHHLQCFGHDVPRVQLRVVVHERLVVVVDPPVGQHHAAEDGRRLLHAVQEAALQQRLVHLRREAPDGVLLHSDQRLVVVGQPGQQLRVQGLDPPRVRDGGGDAHLLEHLRRLQALAEAAAHREDGQGVVAALAGDPALARLQEPGLRGQLHVPVAVAAGVPEGGWVVVDHRQGVDHVHELRLVSRRADQHVGHARHEGQVEGPTVRGAVSTHKTSAVQHETHGQLLQRDIVDQLVVTSLEEGRVDRAEGLHAARGEARGKGHGVLLRDAHVVGAGGPEALLEDADARAAGHGGRDGDDLLVALGLLHQRLREDLRQGLRRGLLLLRRGRGRGGGGGDVELGPHGVELVLGLHGRGVALALLRLDVEEHGLLQLPVLMLSLDV